MAKQKLRYGYKIIDCPICKSKTFEYCSYSDDCWGAMITVERHGNCKRCGYRVEQAYSEPLEGFFLNLNKIRHIERFFDLREAHSLDFAKLSGLQHKCNHSIP